MACNGLVVGCGGMWWVHFPAACEVSVVSRHDTSVECCGNVHHNPPQPTTAPPPGWFLSGDVGTAGVSRRGTPLPAEAESRLPGCRPAQEAPDTATLAVQAWQFLRGRLELPPGTSVTLPVPLPPAGTPCPKPRGAQPTSRHAA